MGSDVRTIWRSPEAWSSARRARAERGWRRIQPRRLRLGSLSMTCWNADVRVSSLKLEGKKNLNGIAKTRKFSELKAVVWSVGQIGRMSSGRRQTCRRWREVECTLKLHVSIFLSWNCSDKGRNQKPQSMPGVYIVRGSIADRYSIFKFTNINILIILKSPLANELRFQTPLVHISMSA